MGLYTLEKKLGGAAGLRVPHCRYSLIPTQSSRPCWGLQL